MSERNEDIGKERKIKLKVMSLNERNEGVKQ